MYKNFLHNRDNVFAETLTLLANATSTRDLQSCEENFTNLLALYPKATLEEKIQLLEISHPLMRHAYHAIKNKAFDAYQKLLTKIDFNQLPLKVRQTFYAEASQTYWQLSQDSQTLTFYSQEGQAGWEVKDELLQTALAYAGDGLRLSRGENAAEAAQLSRLETLFSVRLANRLTAWFKSPDAALAEREEDAAMGRDKSLTQSIARLKQYSAEWQRLSRLDNEVATAFIESLVTPVLTAFSNALHAACQAELKAFAQVVNELIPIAEHLTAHGQGDKARELYQMVVNKHQGEAASTAVKRFDVTPIIWARNRVKINLAPNAPGGAAEKPAKLWMTPLCQVLHAARQKLVESLHQGEQDLRVAQQAYQKVLISLVNTCLLQAEAWLGQPPTEYCWLGLGSVSRGDMGPYSDMECALLIEKEAFRTHPYFQRLLSLLQIQFDALGEPWIRAEGRLTWVGLHVDEDVVSGFQGASPILIQTPEKMALWMSERLLNPAKDGAHIHAHALLQAISLHASAKGPALMACYCQVLKQEMENKRYSWALQAWQQHQVTWGIQSQKAKLLFIKKEAKLDIKRTYLNALTHWCLEAGCYFGLVNQEGRSLTHPLAILQGLQAQSLFAPAWLAWLRREWIALQRWRCDLQWHRPGQPDEVEMACLTPTEKRRLERMSHLLLTPAYEAVTRYLAELQPTKGSLSKAEFDPTLFYLEETKKNFSAGNEAANYQQWFIAMTDYLLTIGAPLARHRYYYRLLPEKYRAACLTICRKWVAEQKSLSDWSLSLAFEQMLWDPPYPDGRRSSHIEQQRKWQTTLANWLVPEESVKDEGHQVYIRSVRLGNREKRALHPAIVRQLLQENWMNKEGKFAYKQDHPIGKTMAGNHLVIPVKVAGIIAFYLKVYPEYPLVEFFLNDLTDRLAYYSPREVDVWYWQSGQYDYPVLVSAAVLGETLQASLMRKELINFNPLAFSQQVLVSSLVRLEDNKPDNLIVVKEGDESRLCLVDADRWFVSAFKANQLQAKDIVFCFSDMDKTVHPLLLQDLLCLNPQQLLAAWVQEIRLLADSCIEIFQERTQTYYEQWNNPERKSLLLPPLKMRVVDELFDHLNKLQAAAEQTTLTHWDVVATLNPRWANHYRRAFKVPLAGPEQASLQRFKWVAGHAYQQGLKNQTEYFTSKINFQTYQQDLWTHLPKGKKVIAWWQADIKAIEAQVSGLTDTLSYRQDAVKQIREGNSALRFKQMSIRGKEKLLAELDWSSLPEVGQRLLLDVLLEGEGWHHLTLVNSAVLRDRDVQKFLASSPELKTLVIKGCSALTYAMFNTLPPDSTLQELVLEDLPNLYYVGYLAGYLFNAFCLPLPHLNALTVQRCEELISIHIASPVLTTLKLAHLPALTLLRTQSEQLKTLQLEEVSLALEEWQHVAGQESVTNLEKITGKMHAYYPSLSQLIARLPCLISLDRLVFKGYEGMVELYARRFNLLWEKRTIEYAALDPSKRTAIQEVVQNSLKAMIQQYQGSSLPQMVEILLRFAEDKKFWVRAGAAEGLSQIGEYFPQESIKALVKFTEDKMYWIEEKHYLKEAAVKGLSRLGGHAPLEAIQVLLKLVTDEASWLRKLAPEGLEQIEGQVPGEVMKVLLSLQKSKQSAVRAGAARGLGQLGRQSPQKALKALGTLVEDKESQVRKAAAEGISQLGGHASLEGIKALVKLVEDKEYQIRIAAAEGLGQIGGQAPLEAIKALLTLVEDKEYQVRMAAAKGLGQLEGQAPQEALKALLKLAEDKDEWVRKAAAEGLGQVGEQASEEALKALVTLAEDKTDKMIREAAAKGLRQIGKHAPQGAMTALLKVAKEKDYQVRKAAAEGLGQLGGQAPQEALKALVMLAEDKHFAIRASAVKGLSQLGCHAPLEVIKVLLKLATDETSLVRKLSAKGLGQLGGQAPQEALKALGMLVEDKESQVRKAAAKGLSQLGGHASLEGIKALVKLVEDKETQIRIAAAEGLGRIGEQAPLEAIKALLTLEEDKEYQVKKAAAEGLRQIGEQTPQEALKAILKLAEDKEYGTVGRVSVAKGLRQLGRHAPEEAIKILVKLAEDKEEEVRAAAAEGLGQLGDHAPFEVLTVLLKLAEDKEEKVRRAAAKGLGQIGGHAPLEALTALIKLAGDKEKWVRKEVAIALGQVFNVEADRMVNEAVEAALKNMRDSGLILISMSEGNSSKEQAAAVKSKASSLQIFPSQSSNFETVASPLLYSSSIIQTRIPNLPNVPLSQFEARSLIPVIEDDNSDNNNNNSRSRRT